MSTPDPARDKDRKVFDPVWLAAGRMFVQCRLFEDGLLYLLSSVEQYSNPAEPSDFDDRWDFHSSKTVGQLAVSLRKVLDVPADFERMVQEGVKARNEFIHGFLRDLDWSLTNPEGRASAVAKLREAGQYIAERRLLVMQMTDQVILAGRKRMAKVQHDKPSA